MTESSLLMDAPALSRLSGSGVLIADCRFVLADPAQGGRLFRAGHIPGAVHADLDRDLSDLSRQGSGRHPLPTGDAFSRALSRWGWEPGRRVVVYDAAGGAMAAARLWWMLGCAGIAAQVLDGGWAAWLAAGLPMEIGEEAPRAPTGVSVRFDPARMADYADVERLRHEPDALILDVRAAERYRGETEPIDRVAGHVPGARNRPVPQNLGSDGRFKSAAELHAEFSTLLAGRDPRKVVHMCGSGVYACESLLAMELAGLHGSRVFVPSWSGWSSDPARPVATGDEEQPA